MHYRSTAAAIMCVRIDGRSRLSGVYHDDLFPSDFFLHFFTYRCTADSAHSNTVRRGTSTGDRCRRSDRPSREGDAAEQGKAGQVHGGLLCGEGQHRYRPDHPGRVPHPRAVRGMPGHLLKECVPKLSTCCRYVIKICRSVYQPPISTRIDEQQSES